MKINLGVFFGGVSVEHEVSVITAIQALGAIDKDKYEAVPIYITKNGDMYCGDEIGKIDSYTDIPALLKKSMRVILVPENNKVMVVKYPMRKFGNNTITHIDAAFPMGHGTNVEDGVLQGYLQTLGIPYVGCDVLASAVGMNKYLQKLILTREEIPVLDAVCVSIDEYTSNGEEKVKNLEDKFGFPIIIKPINLGSSVGIKIGRDTESLTEALEHAFMFSGQILAERAIKNLKEINVAILGDSTEAIAGECEEPISGSGEGILSYDDKYTSGAKSSGMASLSRKIPAEIPSEQREKIRELGIKCFKALGCNGVARLDFMIDLDNDEIYFNEINTVPGSLAFYLWEPMGIKYKELLDRMVRLALKRDRERKNINFSFDTNILKNAKFGGSKGSKR